MSKYTIETLGRKARSIRKKLAEEGLAPMEITIISEIIKIEIASIVHQEACEKVFEEGFKEFIKTIEGKKLWT
ncbi:unnamed protein product [marine sediment metagenome]|uniref:Uncharacterized protein n=1 Tax=marine sediment metagenome TaxID=412755 RepID=X1HTL0_9ZZZZ